MNYWVKALLCDKVLDTVKQKKQSLTFFLCNLFYCQVDFEYSNKQKKDDTIHIGF